MSSGEPEISLFSEANIIARSRRVLESYAESEQLEFETLNRGLLDQMIKGNSELVSSEVSTIHQPSSIGDFQDLTFLVEIEDAGKKGVSIWIGNIRFDFKKAVAAAAQSAIGVSTPLPPWAYLFSILLGIYQLDGLTKVPLGETEASVLYTMWLRCDAWKRIPDQGLRELVNDDRATHGRLPLSMDEFKNALSLLEKIKLIRLDKQTGMWLLLDEIRVKRKRSR